jgi:hypothetical protein
LNALDLSKILEIQTRVRVFLARYFARHLKNQTRLKKKYFLEEEYSETLSQ